MNKPDKNVVGVIPWLPWPLSGWSWWTQPVRAERLALLRIGLALCLLVDIGLNYAPETITFFSTGSLGDPGLHDWRFKPPRMTWSLLRGVGDDVLIYLSLATLILTTLWILGNSSARLLARNNRPPEDQTGIAAWVWTFALFFYTMGLWAGMIARKDIDPIAWIVPVLGFSTACLFCSFDLGTRLLHGNIRVPRLSLFAALAMAMTLSALGYAFAQLEEIDKSAWWVSLLDSWQDDHMLLKAAMGMWIVAAVMLLLGCCTRFAAVLTWMMSMSFANANPYLDNAGDTIRMILLFYLMLCPCGAVWSIDALFKKPERPVYVSPWPIRLIFVQMIFVYSINGFYKLFGANWIAGSSLHYVLGDLVLARVSAEALPIPVEVTRVMTWSVLIWEATFPLMVWWKWSRRVALFFGILFHVGIFATMELAGFVPYALCMYLPLFPFEWFERKAETGEATLVRPIRD